MENHGKPLHFGTYRGLHELLTITVQARGYRCNGTYTMKYGMDPGWPYGFIGPAIMDEMGSKKGQFLRDLPLSRNGKKNIKGFFCAPNFQVTPHEISFFRVENF